MLIFPFILRSLPHFFPQVPSWVLPANVHVRITHSGLHIAIDGVMGLRRTFWGVETAAPDGVTAGHHGGTATGGGAAEDTSEKALEEGPGAGGYRAVVPELCTWTIEVSGSGTSQGSSGSGTNSRGGPRRPSGRTLTVHLALPPPSQEDVMYKKGEHMGKPTIATTTGDPHL